jgi:hypothetical protein
LLIYFAKSMPDSTLTTLAVATGGAFLGKFVGPAAEYYGKLTLERAQQLGVKATVLLAQVGREPQPVEPKLLLPLVQAASLEMDEVLAEKWAALLANAADPVQRVEVQPGFTEVLRQLMPTDAQALETVVGLELPPNGPIAEYVSAYPLLKRFAPLNPQKLKAIVGNLTRLGLCLSVSQKPVSHDSWLASRTPYRTIGPGFDYLQLTPFGSAFLAAVTAPTL